MTKQVGGHFQRILLGRFQVGTHAFGQNGQVVAVKVVRQRVKTKRVVEASKCDLRAGVRVGALKTPQHSPRLRAYGLQLALKPCRYSGTGVVCHAFVNLRSSVSQPEIFNRQAVAFHTHTQLRHHCH